MASKSELALAALVAAFATTAAAPGAAIPPPTRNELLPTNFSPFGAVNMFFNILDGDGEVTDQLLGTPDGTMPAYEIEHAALVELVVEAADQAVRDDRFDQAMLAIDDALIADRTLGGAVDYAAIKRIDRTNLNFTGTVGIKAAELTIALTFTSPRPF